MVNSITSYNQTNSDLANKENINSIVWTGDDNPFVKLGLIAIPGTINSQLKFLRENCQYSPKESEAEKITIGNLDKDLKEPESFLGRLKEKPMNYSELQNYYNLCSSKTKNRKPQTFSIIKNFFDKKIYNDKDFSIDPELFNALAGEDGNLSYEEFMKVREENYFGETKKDFGETNYYNRLQYKNLGQLLTPMDAVWFKERVLGEKFNRREEEPVIKGSSPKYLVDNELNIYDFTDTKTMAKICDMGKSQLENILNYFKTHDLKFKDIKGNEISIQKLLTKFDESDLRLEVFVGKNENQLTKFDLKGVLINAYNHTYFTDNEDILKEEGITDDFLLDFIHELMHSYAYFNKINGSWGDHNKIENEIYAEHGGQIVLAYLHKDPNRINELENYNFLSEDSPYKKYEKIFLSNE